ncbi:uncharacterized protein LOC131051349 isoform X2 [Cryptomeria japonica]|uniref:uncharacterized protein LOC131051349 isoform X2 n=1 Tax=Cryptomeria japonica TaxID=3369 RepID=UPI0027D9DBD2|nr:uncharacterized protein LOC131051349 isoform X2 [Cryptomeria japonica]
MMSTPNLRRSKRDHVARRHSSGPSYVGEGKAGVHESQGKLHRDAKDHLTKVEANLKNTGAPKRLDARGYRQAVNERFNLKGLKKENGGTDKTKNQGSNSSTAVVSKTEIKGSFQTGEQVVLQVESKDERSKDEEQEGESEPGDSRQSNIISRLDKSIEKLENSCFSRKRKQAEIELQQDVSVSGTRSGKIYKCDVTEPSDGKSIEVFDRGEKESSLLDDSGMDLFVSMPIGDKMEIHEQVLTENQYSGECVQCIDCQKRERPGNIQVSMDSWRCNDCNALHATHSILQRKSKHSLTESSAHIQSNAIVDLVDEQDSGNEDSKSDENSMSNDTRPKKFVWAEIQKGRWWPAFIMLQSDQRKKNSSSPNKGSELAELIYSDDPTKESKLVEARSVRPFGENYDQLKNIHNSKGFLDAVSKAYKLYQDYLQKKNQVESSRQEEEPVIPLQKDEATGKLDMDGGASSTVAQNCCDGQNCNMTYHLHCLKPPLVQVPLGEWYCPTCAYRRVSNGVHSVCKGIESIWETKDLDTEQNEIGKATERDLSIGRKVYHNFGKERNGCFNRSSMSALDQRENNRNKEELCSDSMIVGQNELPIKTTNKTNSKRQEKIYFVKYRGLSHLHNRWVNEKLLIDEAPKKLANFKKKLKEGKAPKWNPEWTEPHRLIQKRSLLCANPEEEWGETSADYCVEWYVKWKGLGYDQCTWELESTDMLTSNSAKDLMKAFEIRSEEAQHRASTQQADKAKTLRNKAFSRLKKLPDWMKGGLECSINLKCINKLREFWQNHRNALIIDDLDQERIMTVIAFILSLIKEFNITRPILIITSTAGVPIWESEILQWVPSGNTVAYYGNQKAREVIQKLEFFDESGCLMAQIVLSTPDIVSADLDLMKSIEWEALIIDECQHFKLSKVIAQLKQLTVDFRLLLFNKQMKENTAELSHFLSFLDPRNDYIPEHQHQDGSEYLVSLKGKLLEYTAHERKSDSLSSANFIEYWVPVELANVQVEQYCTILMTNGNSLCSMLKKNDPEALRDILLSLRKCCMHPYLVDGSLQTSLRQGLEEVEYFDMDINVSSKLQLLDNILSELRSEHQRVLILFQMIGRSGGISIGDILDDHIRQRFGVDSYERVDGCLPSNKKQAALQMFNSKDSGRFVFLLEKRACGTSIKLSSIDTVIIFDSDWNPLNDLRALQKLQMDAHAKHLKVFRFYSPYTLEERVLISAKQDNVLDNHLENLSSTVCQTLIKWGTSHLFKRYDEIHDSNSHTLKSNSDNGSQNLKSLAKNILACAHDGFQTHKSLENSVIQRVPRSGGYGKGIQMFGESENLLKEEETPSNFFWAQLLKGRHMVKHGVSGQLQRTRRKVQYSEKAPMKPISDPDESEARKRRRRVTETVDPISITSWLEDKKKSLAGGKESSENYIETHTDEANQASTESIQNSSGKSSNLMGKKSHADMPSDKYPSPCSGSCDTEIEIPSSDHEKMNYKTSTGAQAFRVEEHEDGKALRVAQQCLHSRIKPELVGLCKILQFPDEVTSMAEELLSYVMNNYRLPKEPTSLLQAVEISLCCAAAGCLKYNMDLDASIELAKSQLNFECKRAEIDSVYSKLREQCLKLRGDIPCTAGQCGSRVTPSPVNSASQRPAGEMHPQDTALSTSKNDNHSKILMQIGAIQEPSNVQDSPGVHDNEQEMMDAVVDTDRRDEQGNKCMSGSNLPEQETLETISPPNIRPVEDDSNHVEEDISTCVTNRQDFILLDPMGVAHTSSNPATCIPSHSQLNFLSPEKIKIIKEYLQSRKQKLLRQQQAEVKDFFKQRAIEERNLEERHAMDCHKIKSMNQNPEVRDSKLKETKVRHVEMVAQVKEQLRKALHDLKNRQSALREKENKIFTTCLEDINAGRISKFLSDLMKSGSIHEVADPVQNTSNEACEPIDNALHSASESGRSIPMPTSEQQQQDKAPVSESHMATVSSQSPDVQENQLVCGPTTSPMNGMPQNEMNNLLNTCRPSLSLERSRSGLCTHVPSQADTSRSSPGSHTQHHLNQGLSLQPDSMPLSRGSGDQSHQASEPANEGMPGMSRSQIEHVENMLSLNPSSSQPLQETDVVEISGSVIETSTATGSLPRGNESFYGMQYANPGSNPMQFRVPVPARSQQTNFSDPLYHETLKIRKEIERNSKLHEEETTRIQNEFAKELEEMKRRYTGMLQQMEFAFAHRKRTLEINLVKVDKNRRLAEAFKIKDNNTTVPSVHSGSAIHSHQSRQPTIPVSNVRLPQLATAVVNSGSPVLVSDVPASCSLASASGIQAGGMFCSPSSIQGNDVWSSGVQFPPRLFNPGLSAQNTQAGQGTQSNCLPHNFGVASDMINRNVGLSGCSSSINSFGLSAQPRQLQSSGNIGDIMSQVFLPETNSITSQILQQQETSNSLGSPGANASSGSLPSSFMPGQQSQPNCHNPNFLANTARGGATIIESGMQDATDIVSGNGESLYPLQGPSATSQVQSVDIPQVSPSSLQEMNDNPVVENLYGTNIQQPIQENVLLEDNGNVGASLVYGNNTSDASTLARGPTCGPESEVSPPSLPVPVRPNCNNIAHSIDAQNFIYLSDDD